MPLIIPQNIPAFKLLKDFVFVMDKKRAQSQDIRPLSVVIFNLMPTKIETENQLLALLGNSPLQVNVTFLHTKSYEGKHTPKSHLERFYVDFEQIKGRKFDAAIVTGAPIEHLRYEEVKYWDELKRVMCYLKKHTTSTLYLCWGAMAALYHFHQIPKISLKHKLFGVFKHKIKTQDLLLSGLDEEILLPHSRHSGLDESALKGCKSLKVLLFGKKSGASVLRDEKDLYILAHPEYTKFTLFEEYERDLKKGEKIKKPKNYFDKRGEPVLKWRANAQVLFSNWLNFVYQETPFRL